MVFLMQDTIFFVSAANIVKIVGKTLRFCTLTGKRSML